MGRSKQGPIRLLLVVSAACCCASAENSANGYLMNKGHKEFPIGCYELPSDDVNLRAIAAAGFNLVRCRDVHDLDRAHAAGMMGWVPVPLESGAKSDVLRTRLESVMNHPALAVWEGPDEVVWNFTAFSGLFRSGAYKQPGEWWRQTSFAVERAEAEAKKILPQLRAGCELLRRIDRQKHPIWINEAAESDMKFVREYLDEIDITGCDTYPIHENKRLPASAGDFAARFQRIGKGKPVWMVLQGFSWHELTPPKDERLVYPSFTETRLMAYDAIAHGARGLLYWGTEVVPKDSPFRQSLFALTSELKELQPFLIAKDHAGVTVSLVESSGRAAEGDRGVRSFARRAGRDWLIVLVNEDDRHHMGVEVGGLSKLNAQNLEVLYAPETAAVKKGGFVTRLRPYEVKVLASSRKWESSRQAGREFQ